MRTAGAGAPLHLVTGKTALTTDLSTGLILKSASPLGATRLRRCILKVEGATNRRNGSRASCQGRAQNPRSTLSWAWSQILGLQLPRSETLLFTRFLELAPQKQPTRLVLAIFGPTMSATPQFEVKIEPNLAPYRQYLEPDDARKGYHEPNMSAKRLLQVTRSPEL